MLDVRWPVGSHDRQEIHVLSHAIESKVIILFPVTIQCKIQLST